MSEQYQGLFGTAAAGAATRREDTDVVYNDSNWREGAACRDEDPEQFFFNDNPSTKNEREGTRETRAICGRCVVTDFCLRAALDNSEPAGIWGGLTTGERDVLKRAARRSVR